MNRANALINLVESSRSFSSAAVARKVREVPELTREQYLAPEKIRRPIYMAECRGTPRREYPVNMIDGIRVAATFNPYQAMTRKKRKQLDTWKSRDWEDWNPYECYFGVGGRRYQIPHDLRMKSNELKEEDQPTLRRQAMADIKKQYIMHGLPWVWDKDFYNGKVHPRDKEEIPGQNKYNRKEKVKQYTEALRDMDELKFQYIKEKREKKRHTWWERVIKTMGGEQALEQYARLQKVPRLI